MTNRFCAHSVLFWYLFPSLLRNSGNKHQHNSLVSAETVRHSSTYIILYVSQMTTWSHGWHFNDFSQIFQSFQYHILQSWEQYSTVRVCSFILSSTDEKMNLLFMSSTIKCYSSALREVCTRVSSEFYYVLLNFECKIDELINSDDIIMI